MIGLSIFALVLGQVPLTGTVTDPAGRPLAGVELLLAQGPDPDGAVPVLGRFTTDALGQYQMGAPAPGRRPVGGIAPAVFAFRPGSGLIDAVTSLKGAAAEPGHLAMEPSQRRTVTLRDGDGRPLAGFRLAPLLILPSPGNYGPGPIPDELVDRLAVTSRPDGQAELACLAATTELLAVRVTFPHGGAQMVALARDQARSEAVTLVLKLAGRLSGRVRRDDGQPAAGVVVEVWSRAGRLLRPLPVRFEGGPIRGAADGSFHTPPILLAGVNYRAVIRVEGFPTVLTDWVAAAGTADAAIELPQVVLKPPRALSGRVVDRQGQPISDVEVVAAGKGASAATDEQGRFRLGKLPRNPVMLVIRRAGYRIDGRLLAESDDTVEFVLARFDESPARTMATLPDEISDEERVRLARGVLDPRLVKVLSQGKDSDKVWALRSLMTFDPAKTLEILGQTAFQENESRQGILRRELANRMARDDVEEAAAVAESITTAFWRAQALALVYDHVARGERARKLDMLDRAQVSLRAVHEPALRITAIGDVAGRLFDLGETDRAQTLFAEGLALTEQLKDRIDRRQVSFIYSLIHADLPAALEFVEKIKDSNDRIILLGNIAAWLAARDPAAAERLLGKIQGQSQALRVTLRTCQNMARTDLPRARRLAQAQQESSSRASALVFAASGLPSSEHDAARALVRRALEEIDQGDMGANRNFITLPALLPLVEAVDPGLVPELFWRGVADLAPDDDPRSESGRGDMVRGALLLARYDRKVAAALLDTAAEAGPAPGTKPRAMSPAALLLLAAIDPRRAAQAVETMPDPADSDSRSIGTRVILSEFLGRATQARWADVWRSSSGLGAVLGPSDSYLD
jgi:hypothetical protein